MELKSCKRCGHEWLPRTENIKLCPRCKSRYWNKDRGDSEIKKSDELLKYFPHYVPRGDQTSLSYDISRFLNSNIKTMIFQGETGMGKESVVASQVMSNLNDYDYVIWIIPKHTAKENIRRELDLISTKKKINVPYFVLDSKRILCNQKDKFKEKDVDINEFCNAIRGKTCPYYAKDQCDYYNSLKKLLDYKIIIADYNYILNPYIRNRIFEKILDKKILLIINEVHQLPKRAVDSQSSKLSEETIKNAEKEAINYQKNLNISKSVINEIKKIRRKLENRTKDSKVKEFKVSIGIFKEFNYKKFKEIGEKIINYKHRNKIGEISHLYRVGNFIENFQSRKYDYYVHYISIKETPKKKKKKYDVSYACLYAYPILKKPFEIAHKIILYSGTCYPERYERMFYLNKFGGVFVPEKRYKSPYTDNRTNFFYLDGRLTQKYRESEYIKKTARELNRVIKKVEKPIIIWVVSPLWNEISRHLKLNGYKIYIEKMGVIKSKADYSKLKKYDISILSPFGSFSESVDIPKIRTMIMLGIPTHKLNFVAEETEKFYKKKMKEGAAISLLRTMPSIERAIQSMSRSIRTKNDKILAIWFDERWIHNMRYVYGNFKTKIYNIKTLLDNVNLYNKTMYEK